LIRSFDPEVLRKAVEPYPDSFDPNGFDFEAWLDSRNVMFEEDGSVGLFSYDSPYVYTGHWYFKKGHRPDLAKDMISVMYRYYGMEVLKGFTPIELRGVILVAKRLGMKSYGVTTGNPPFHNKQYELLIMTKNEFYKRNK
jgi:hypothetical protein